MFVYIYCAQTSFFVINTGCHENTVCMSECACLYDLYCFNNTWARDRASEIGYDLGTNKLAVRMLRDVLGLRTSCAPNCKYRMSSEFVYLAVL